MKCTNVPQGMHGIYKNLGATSKFLDVGMATWCKFHTDDTQI